MNINLITLKDWIDTQYKSYPSTPPKQRMEETAEDLECGVATLYRWLKDGSVYIELVGPSICGDDSSLVVWHMKKHITP